MKILFSIDSLITGGKERRLVELMKGLKLHQNIEFELAIMNNDVHYEEVFGFNITIHYMIRKSKKDISVFYRFYKICREFKPDIVHCWDSMSVGYLLPTCKLQHIKLINGMITDSPAKQNIFNKKWIRAKLTFPFSNIVIGNSMAGLKAYNAPKNKSIVIHNGFNFDRTKIIIDNETIKKQVNSESKFIIGMVASFSQRKDYKTYFEAAQLLLSKRNDIIFWAIGSNTDSPLSENIIEPKYKKHFKLLGRKTGIESFINAMDICILATFTEGISNSILEYMALGKPVIATSGGGTNEIVKDNITGFLINSSNPKELSEKIELLLNDTDLRLKMGIAGKERIKNYFTIEKNISLHISIYNNLMLI